MHTGCPGVRRGNAVAGQVGAMRRPFRVGFTLIEMMVVILIIAMLAAILLPVFANMNRRQSRYTCTNNLREIGTALAQYREDYGVYPAAPNPEYLASQGGDWHTLPFSQLPGASSPTFSGGNSDLNDLTASGSFPTDPTELAGLPATWRTPHTITLEIVATGATDTFRWSVDGVAQTDGSASKPDLPCSTTNTTLGQSWVKVRFAGVTGHTSGNKWTFQAGYIPTDWQEWQHGATTLTESASATDAGLTKLKVANAGQFTADMSVLLQDATTGDAEMAVIESVSAPIITVKTALSKDYPAGATIDLGYLQAPKTDLTGFIAGNLGMASLYFYYLNDTGDYLRSRALFHCPAAVDTADADPAQNPRSVLDSDPDSAPFRTFDPLWAGYNAYDLTYNYDQFYNGIMAFDEAVEHPGMDLVRQLRNPNPPADTVVCWCSEHGKSPGVSRGETDPNVPAASGTPDVIHGLERGRTGDVDLVLWVDGTVDQMLPNLLQKQGTTDYFWVPPYLYSRGDWHR